MTAEEKYGEGSVMNNFQITRRGNAAANRVVANDFDVKDDNEE